MPVVAFETTGIPADATTGIIVVVKPGVSVSAQVSGSVTVLGTALASIVPGVSVTVVTQLGTQIVSVVPGVSVTIQSALSTIVTILSTVNVAIVAGAGGGGSVTTAVPSVSATGQVMWIAGGQSSTAFPVVVTGTVTAGAGTTIVSIQNVVGVTTAASVSVTGLPIWINVTPVDLSHGLHDPQQPRQMLALHTIGIDAKDIRKRITEIRNAAFKIVDDGEDE